MMMCCHDRDAASCEQCTWEAKDFPKGGLVVVPSSPLPAFLQVAKIKLFDLRYYPAYKKFKIGET